jgi:hypothetical protein
MYTWIWSGKGPHAIGAQAGLRKPDEESVGVAEPRKDDEAG